MRLRLSRLGPTPSTYVGTPAFPFKQSLTTLVASSSVGQQPPLLHDTGASGLPSVTSRMTTAWPGFWRRNSWAYEHAPDSAAEVGVSPVGMRPFNEPITCS